MTLLLRTFGIYVLTFIAFTSCLERDNSTSPKEGPSKVKARIKTVHGDMVLVLKTDIAPLTVARVRHLISEGFYDGLEFHKVIPNFIIQTGDPTKTGQGGSGKNIPYEKAQISHTTGVVSIARSNEDLNSADSQFFICLREDKSLDNKYTPFAVLIEGIEVANSINEGDKIITMSLE